MLIERAQEGTEQLCVTPPVVSEFFSVITSPRQVTTPFTAEEALEEVAKCVTPPIVSELFSVITNPRQVTTPFAAEEAPEEIAKFLASENDAQ